MTTKNNHSLFPKKAFILESFFSLERDTSFENDFAIEVHYKGNEAQDFSINRFHKELNKNVYTTQPNSAIMIHQDHLK